MSDSDDLGSPEARLEEAVKQLSLARRDVRAPDQDAALSKAQYLTGGVLRELEEEDDGADPHLISDGGREWRPVEDITKECPECGSLDLEVTTLSEPLEHRCRSCEEEFFRPALRQCPKGFRDYPVVENRRPMPDGGSKYVNPTGDGYCGVGRVSGGSVSFGVGMFPVDWTGDTRVYAVEESPGVALVEDEPDEFLGSYQVSNTWGGGPGASVSVGAPALKPLGVSHGDDVRVYERDAGGLLLVPADDDPFVDGGDGS